METRDKERTPSRFRLAARPVNAHFQLSVN